MSTHASPDDLCFTRGDLAPILEGRPTVGGPRHLEDAGGPLHTLHPKTRSKRSSFEVRHELCDRRQKGCLLVSRQAVEVGAEAGQPGKGGHALSTRAPGPPWSFGPTSQGRQELLAGAEDFQPTAGKIGIRFPLPVLPLLRPKPRLGGVDDLLGPEKNPLGGDLGIQEIAFFEMRSGADLLGKSQLSFGPQRGPRHDHSLADLPNIRYSNFLTLCHTKVNPGWCTQFDTESQLSGLIDTSEPHLQHNYTLALREGLQR